MRPIIETKCSNRSCRVLLCLLTLGLIKSSDQCDSDHFKVQIVFRIASTWAKM